MLTNFKDKNKIKLDLDGLDPFKHVVYIRTKQLLI